MEVMIEENNIVVIRTMKHLVTKEDVHFTYGLSCQMTSARDLHPSFEPLEKDMYPITILNKKEALEWYKEGKLKVIGSTQAFEKIMLED